MNQSSANLFVDFVELFSRKSVVSTISENNRRDFRFCNYYEIIVSIELAVKILSIFHAGFNQFTPAIAST